MILPRRAGCKFTHAGHRRPRVLYGPADPATALEGGTGVRMILRAATLAALVLAYPAAALAGTSAGQPFPTNLDTIPDATQLTSLRVDVPRPDCTARPSDCADIAVLDTLDGFNIQPRIKIPFSGPIDTSTVSSSTIFLIGPE